MTIDAMSSEGHGIARPDGKVVFVEGAVPGDVVTARTYKRRKSFDHARITELHTPSDRRTETFCPHVEACGGCKWQHIGYDHQAAFKQDTVEQAIRRIGGLDGVEMAPIVPARDTRHYRNKLEFTFSRHRYMSPEEIATGEDIDNRHGLGFHAPGIFDKVVDVTTCYLMDERQDHIRNTARRLAIESGRPFYKQRDHSGFFRNLVVRNTTLDEWMVVVIFGEDDQTAQDDFLNALVAECPVITSGWAITNTKWNDSYADLEPRHVHGTQTITEQLGHIRFGIGPTSFFQTNTVQAVRLFDEVADLAGLSGTETVYDLYAGVGSIGLYLAKDAARVVGIEVVDEAVEDATRNAALNGIDHASFHCGDVRALLDVDFLAAHGRPDVLVTDPPRAGMHPDVVNVLLQSDVPRIVYVSCNPSTQARDLHLLADRYDVLEGRPVDLFPHTPHVENVALLTLRDR